MTDPPTPDAAPTGPDPGLEVSCAHPVRHAPDVDLETLARRVLEGERCAWTYVGIVLADHEMVHRLNREYLGHDYRTDVLSFLIDRTDRGIEGEVYVDLDTAESNAARFGEPYEREVARCVVHGLLHLAGHDDPGDDERARMRRLEDRYLGPVAVD
jgi:rRNA maturation RNase YbeY